MVRTIGDLGDMGRLIAGADRNQAQAWADRTCAEQGLSAKISDGRTVATVATLLGGEGLDAPERREAIGVEVVATANGRADGDVIEDRRDDGVLARQRKRGPPGSEARSVPNEAIQR